jgi:hypothetical protein
MEGTKGTMDKDVAGDTPVPVTEWVLFSERRPTDSDAMYWFTKDGLGIEWADKLHYVGMGYSDSEYWPPHSYWNGYVRTLPEGIKWRLAEKDVAPKTLRFPEMHLKPCPFCGGKPHLDGSHCGRPGGGDGVTIGAEPWRWNTFYLQPCCSMYARYNGFPTWQAFEKKWNTRFDNNTSPQSLP